MNTALFKRVSKGKDFITQKDLLNIIQNGGLSINDKRLKSDLLKLEGKDQIHFNQFQDIIQSNALLNRLFLQELVVPEWDEFKNEIIKIFDECCKIKGGKVSDATPKIASSNENHFGVSICTIDGQRLNLGDTSVDICIQSVSTILSYLLAANELGSKNLHAFVGKEAPGNSEKNLKLKEISTKGERTKYIPHNPFCEAGGILCSSLIGKKMSDAERFGAITKVLSKATDSEKINFSHQSFLYERNNSDKRTCLAYMMRECKSFPGDTDVLKGLELYFQLLSLELNTEQMSVLAATLANGGVCPATGETVFDIGNVRDCLSLMLSCGLNNYSGEWAFNIGLSAKSAVSGCILIAIPNKMGISIYSPRLDNVGNSYRAIRFAELLVKCFSFHYLDSTREFGEGDKIQPFRTAVMDVDNSAGISKSESSSNLAALMSAAESGDVDEIRGLITEHVDLTQKNYDRRSALHLAAAGNYSDVVEVLVADQNGEFLGWEELSRPDRWGLTPLDVAIRNSSTEVADLLRKRGAKRGSEL